MVGEHVVDAAGVDIEPRPEMAQRHRGAFEVPAGEALAPTRRRPLQLAALAGRLPQGEVRRVALVAFDLPAVPGPQRVHGVPRERPVGRQRVDREVHVPRVADVRVAGIDQPLGEVDHLGDVLRRPREHVGRQEVEQGRVGVERCFVGVGDLRGRLVLEPGRDQHSVLAAVEPLVPQMPDVRDVLDVEDRDSVVQHDPADQVGEEERPEVPDMGEPVDRRAAGVHPEAGTVARFHRVDRPGQGVPQPERHREIIGYADVLRAAGRLRQIFLRDRPNVSGCESLSGQRPRWQCIVPPAV